MRRLAALLTALALIASPCAAAIGTPVNLGTVALTTGGLNSEDLTLLNNANAGQMIAVMVLLGSSRTPTITDTAGNCGAAYTQSSTILPAIAILWVALCPNPASGMTAGTDKIHVSWTGGTDTPNISAFQVSGLDLTAPLDVTTSVSTGSGMAVSPALSITSGTGAQLITAVTATNGNAGVYTTDTGHSFANVNKNQEALGGQLLAIDAQVVGSTTTVLNAPSWTISIGYASVGFTFKAAAGAATPKGGLLLRGVGR